jgi:hypothetical protein
MLLFLLLFASISFTASAQDTLFFRDGSYAVGSVVDLGITKFTYLQIDEKGNKLMKAEKAIKLDSVHFGSGIKYTKGASAPIQLNDTWKSFASYWHGRQLGALQTSFTKTQIGLHYLGGVLILGLPFTLYKATAKPKLMVLTAEDSVKYQQDSHFERGYRRGARGTMLTALLPVYMAGVLTTFLSYTLLVPQRNSLPDTE